ncbi:MAG: ABC transporter ATP-binding protein/permease [Planctomycetes bacterium]|nr:ABC transporter ATP-binding protein/permease [Planctomycetota bacterium]
MTPPLPPSPPPDAGLRPFRLLLPILRPYRQALAIGALAILATQAAQGWLPIPFRHAIEALEGGRPNTELAMGWAAVFLAVTAIRGMSQWVMRRLIVAVSRDMERDLRDTLYAKVVRQSPAWIGRQSTGDLMSRFTSDVEAVRMSAGPGLMYVVNTIALLPWALWFMFSMSPVLAWLNLIPLAVLAIGTRIVSPRMHAASTAMQEAQGALSTQAQESFAGVRVVKSFAREEAEVAGFRRAAETTLTASLRTADVQSLFYPMIGLLKWLGFVLTIFFGGRMMARGELTLGTFLAFHLYAGMLLWPMISLGWVLALWQRGKVAMARLATILEAPRGIDDAATSTGPPSPADLHAIEVRGLTFTYPGASHPALVDVSFRVAPGHTVAIVGGTGSGKSTLLATIPRLLDPPAGTVLVDGFPVESRRLADLRAPIGYVPQDTFLFSDTVGANIAMGLPSAEDVPARAGDDPRVRRAAEEARILPEIEALPQGFETLLGERGVNLSGGQRQRTAIARALVRDPKILLLDDCLSAVDAKTESEILANLREVLRGRTTLLVTHRVSAAKLADEVLVLEEGRVVERGTPATLLASDGPFAHLARRQSLEDALEAA